MFHVQAQLQGSTHRRQPVQFVVKVAATETHRKFALYHVLQATAAAGLTPRLLGTLHVDTVSLLFLEWVRPVQRWPWRDISTAGLVLARVTRLHQWQWASVPEKALQWDYDAALRQSGYATLEALEHVV